LARRAANVGYAEFALGFDQGSRYTDHFHHARRFLLIEIKFHGGTLSLTGAVWQKFIMAGGGWL